MMGSILLLVLQTLFFTPLTAKAEIPQICSGLPLLGVLEELTEEKERLLPDGYCILYGSTYFYVPGVPTWQFMNNPGPMFFVTRAIYAENSVMDDQLVHHQIDLAAVSAIDGVSLMPCIHTINRQIVYLKLPGYETWDRMIAADCVGPYFYGQHTLPQQNPDGPKGIASSLEITYRYARMRGFDPDKLRGGIYDVLVCITDGNPDEVCVGNPVDSAQWVDDNIRYQ